METHPPISDRTNEQLLEIVETHEEWRPDVVDLARKELINRGVTIKTQETRRTIRIKFHERIKKTKARATYTEIEKMLIVLLGPVLVVLFSNIFMFHSGEGYRKKNRQGVFYLLVGFCLWGSIIYLYFKIAQ